MAFKSVRNNLREGDCLLYLFHSMAPLQYKQDTVEACTKAYKWVNILIDTDSLINCQAQNMSVGFVV